MRGVKGEPQPCLREPQSRGDTALTSGNPSLRRAPLPKAAPRLKEEARPSRGPWRTVLGFTPVALLSQGGQVAEGGRCTGYSELSEPGAGGAGRWGPWS